MTKTVNLALQGGGSHGAFTWGVLDALLEDGRLDFEGITGTSAGGMNGAVLVSGLARGGAEEARAALRTFWRSVARLSRFASVTTPLDRLIAGYNIEQTPGYVWLDLMSRFFSPYDLNPFNINPLQGVLERCVDLEAVQSCGVPRLFISATNVHTGKARIFGGLDITYDAIMASACLPMMFQAVEIDGVPYWDGGYMGNPALYPLHRTTKTEDLVIIQINPIERAETPRTSQEIMNRLNEITFNASLIDELRAIEFVQRLIDQGVLPQGNSPESGKNYKRVRLHRIPADEALKDLPASSKFNADWGFISFLHDAGRAAGKMWLEATFEHIGVRDTMNVDSQIKAPPEHCTPVEKVRG
jgi:NTE family protein